MASEHLSPEEELERVDRELSEMQADEEFCDRYLGKSGGTCEHLIGSRCTKHRVCKGILPAGKMCAIELFERAVELRRQTGELQLERARLREAWEKEPAGKGKDCLRNEILHQRKVRLDLMRERLRVLRHDPVDSTAFFDKLEGLLEQKIGLLETIKLGGLPDGVVTGASPKEDVTASLVHGGVGSGQ